MPLRKIARIGKIYPRRVTKSQKTLIDFASDKLEQNFTGIDEIVTYFNLDSKQEAYDLLQSEYNEHIPGEKIRLKKLKEVNRVISNNFIRLLETREIDEITLDMNEYREHFSLEEILNRIILAVIKNENEGTFYTMQIGNNHYTLNTDVRNRIMEMVRNNLIIDEIHGSDGVLLQEVKNADVIILKRWTKNNTYETPNGAFFKYQNETDMNFERYGIFKNSSKSNYHDNCLIYALKEFSKKENSTLSMEIIEQVKCYVKNLKVPMNVLPRIAEVLKHRIRINNDKHERNYSIYGKEYENEINIGLIDEHYFLIDITEFTTFAIENYHNIKHLKNYQSIYKVRVQDKKEYYKKDINRYINSFQAIKTLLEYKDTHLLRLTTLETELAHTQFYNRVDESFENLNYSLSQNTRKVKKKIENKKKIFYHNVFFDFEANTNDKKEIIERKRFKSEDDFNEYCSKNIVNNYEKCEDEYVITKIISEKHVPYLCCCYFEKDNVIYSKKFIGNDCGKQLLDFIPDNSKLIAHNASYDYRFIVKYFDKITSEISKSNRLICSDARYKEKRIKIKDSYALITMKLSDFSKNLKLGYGMGKDVISHKLYTHENINKKFIDIDYATHFLEKDEEKKIFIENLNEWKLIRDDNTYNCLEYSAIYCLKDCEILSKGYCKFRDMVRNSIGMNIDNILTTPTLGHDYFVNNDCYQDVYELSGTPQKFIQKTVVGGRCMTNSNLMILCFEVLNDFDAVSLYPSAMVLMSFLKGAPKVLNNSQLNYNFLREQDGYFVEIIIQKVGIKRDFSLLSFIDENGVRQWTNDMVGKKMYINKIALEDAIEFQNLEFTVIRGYYFNDGTNNNIKSVIKYLFQERKKWKDEENPIEMIFKLIMNSAYGKSITKEIETESKFFNSKEDFQIYLSKNYNFISEYNEYGNGKYKVEYIKQFNQHFNLAHIGSEILSMSKRIMNRVMCLAEDVKIRLLYTDTDSIHIRDCDIKKLSYVYKNKYNKTLIGNELGQFHTDFELKVDGYKCKNVVSVKSIFLGKKAYIDLLQGTHPISGEYIYGFHIRMKGVNEGAVRVYSLENDMGDDIFKVYKNLYDGLCSKFDLIKGGNLNFKYDKNYNIVSDPIFTRTVNFSGKRLNISEHGVDEYSEVSEQNEKKINKMKRKMLA